MEEVSGLPTGEAMVSSFWPPIRTSRETIEARIGLTGLPGDSQQTHRFSTFEYIPPLEAAWRSAYQFAEEKGIHPFLTLMGPPGVGKTHLVMAIGWHWVLRGYGSVAYFQVERLLDQLRASYGEPGMQGAADQIRWVEGCGLLILDDLGAQKGSEWADAKLDEIVDFRYLNRKWLVVASNVNAEELPPRIADRLWEGQVVVMKGASYRRRRK